MPICLFIILSNWLPDHWKSKNNLGGLIHRRGQGGGGATGAYVHPPLGLKRPPDP